MTTEDPRETTKPQETSAPSLSTPPAQPAPRRSLDQLLVDPDMRLATTGQKSGDHGDSPFLSTTAPRPKDQP